MNSLTLHVIEHVSCTFHVSCILWFKNYRGTLL
jgi:hypothetical protein